MATRAKDDERAEALGTKLLFAFSALLVAQKPTVTEDGDFHAASPSREDVHGLIDAEVATWRDYVFPQSAHIDSDDANDEPAAAGDDQSLDDDSDYVPDDDSDDGSDDDSDYVPDDTAPSANKKRRCTACRAAGLSGEGHIASSRSCPSRKEPLKKKKRAKSRSDKNKKHSCTSCGAHGHASNNKMCPSAGADTGADAAVKIEPASASPKKRMVPAAAPDVELPTPPPKKRKLEVRTDGMEEDDAGVRDQCQFCGSAYHCASSYKQCLFAKRAEGRSSL